MTALTLTLQAPAAPISLPARPPIDIRAHEAVLDVVVPVFNEETDLPGCVRRLHTHLATAFPYSFRITIADNASTDRTLAVADELADELPRVRVMHLAQKGRGRALAAAWSASDATGARLHGRRPVDRPGRAAARWSPRWSRATPTSRSAPGCAAAPGSSAGRSAR